MARRPALVGGHPVVSVTLGAPPVYAAYLLEGLTAVFGRSIRFLPEPSIDHSSYAVVFRIGHPDERRFYVSLGDHAHLDPWGMQWATVYGKVNPFATDCAEYPKLLPVGPTFGIRLTSMSLAARAALASYGGAWSLRSLPRSAYSTIRYRRWRLPIGRYIPGESDPAYVFFAAWPWKKHSSVNPPRARFIEVCRSMSDLVFEGGFAPRRRSDVEEVLPLSAPRRYSLAEYLSKTRRSLAVFNAPAVHDCHGWKLGEFLALGKAIISMPLTRALPATLQHGVHIHYVDGSEESIVEALEMIRRQPAYRRKLEVNSRRWYLEYLQPAALVRRLLAAAEAMAAR
jgi:hypothetical protein